MKRIILTLTFLLSFTISFSQIFWSEDKQSLRYMGDMTDEVISLLDSSELQMYYDCLNIIKLNKDSIVWLKGEHYKKVFYKEGLYTVECAVRETENDRYINSIRKGVREKELPEPMCLIFIMREPGYFRISIQKYF